jgi:hypothetical protein
LPFFGIGFQRQAFGFVRVSELFSASATNSQLTQPITELLIHVTYPIMDNTEDVSSIVPYSCVAVEVGNEIFAYLIFCVRMKGLSD